MKTLQRRLRRRADAFVDCGSSSARGPRPDNQDRCAVSSGWAVVSDGLGGHRGGALAAELVVEAVEGCLRSWRGRGDEEVEATLRAADDAVLARRSIDTACADMCATVTFAVVTSCRRQRSRWLLTNVGDSPAWLLTGDGVVRLTEDHNLAGALVKAGRISSDVALRHPGRHMVTRAIGLPDAANAPRLHVTLRGGEALVIASDGLSELMDGGCTAALLPPTLTEGGPGSSQATAERLVATAVERGATDNVTAAVLRHLG